VGADAPSHCPGPADDDGAAQAIEAATQAADAMPDVVDVVMAMGRVRNEPSAEVETLGHDLRPPRRSRSFAGSAAPSNMPAGVGDAQNWLSGGDAPPLPVADAERLPGHLAGLAGQARKYVEAASSANTRRAYASDWKHFAGWCRRQGFSALPPDPRTVGLYITALAAGTGAASADNRSVATIERRLSSLSWNYAQRGL